MHQFLCVSYLRDHRWVSIDGASCLCERGLPGKETILHDPQRGCEYLIHLAPSLFQNGRQAGKLTPTCGTTVPMSPSVPYVPWAAEIKRPDLFDRRPHPFKNSVPHFREDTLVKHDSGPPLTCRGSAAFIVHRSQTASPREGWAERLCCLRSRASLNIWDHPQLPPSCRVYARR